MGIKEDYQEAVKLTKQGEYSAARNLLLPHDHPKTNQLLERIERIIASNAQAEKPKNDGNAPKTFWTRLILSVLLTFLWFLPGLLCTIFFSKQARKYPDVPGAKAMIYFNRFLFACLALFLILGVIAIVGVVLSY